MPEDDAWDLWVDFQQVDVDGLTHASTKFAKPGVRLDPGQYVLVGDYDADPAVAQVVDLRPNGIVLLRVLPGHANAHLDLIGPRPA
ncbi:MAG: hypothetical protein JO085_03360 [Acidimicrobiia bacterium]|nr:hypothetical protein [Acidimicrobiia bacterium]